MTRNALLRKMPLANSCDYADNQAHPTDANTVKSELGRPRFSANATYPWATQAANRLLVVGFFLFLLLPPIAWLSGWDWGESLNEKRKLAMIAPLSWTWQRLITLPEEVDGYYRDHFGFRRHLIHLLSTIRHKWLVVSTADVVIGKGGWLFYAREGSIDNFLGQKPYSRKDLETWGKVLERRRADLEARGSRYLFMVAPDKASIYPEMLPDYVRAGAGPTRLDQLTSFLTESKARVTFLDLRIPLCKAKSEGLVYLQNDTHWNGRGYYVAYSESMKVLARWFPAIHQLHLGHDLLFREAQMGGGDWSLLGLDDENMKVPGTQLVRTTDGPVHPRALTLPAIMPPQPNPWGEPLVLVNDDEQYSMVLIHDSFMRNGMSDWHQVLFSASFNKVAIIADKPNEARLLALVDRVRPNVVVEEWGERLIKDPFPYTLLSD